MKRTILESKIEERLVKGVKTIGGICPKMVPTFCAGLPDRLVLYRGNAYFVEVKAPGEVQRKLQLVFSKELSRVGFDVTVVDSFETVDTFIDRIIRAPGC